MTKKQITEPTQDINIEKLQQRVEEHLEQQARFDSLVNGGYVSPQEQMKHEIQKIDDWYNGLPSEVQKAIKFMADKGWHWDREMDLQALLDIKDVECTDSDIEAELEEYFESKLDRIEQDIISRLKNTDRKGIILSIFDAHRSGLYNLTIPTTFAQVDGICIDATEDEHFFMMADKKPQVSQHVDDLPKGYLTEAILNKVFKEKIPVNQSERDRGDSFSGLNRHQVLHGEVCDYGTKRNSLKAISLLNYVSIALAGELKYP